MFYIYNNTPYNKYPPPLSGGTCKLIHGIFIVRVAGSEIRFHSIFIIRIAASEILIKHTHQLAAIKLPLTGAFVVRQMN